MPDDTKLAELLFPRITKVPEDYEVLYPPRDLPEGAMVTRFSPSPTGFLHIGNLMPAFIGQLCARASGGVFFLRIEDTDKKREVENGVLGILEGLSAFDILPDEGATSQSEERGAYGPYQQSRRGEIYRCYAKELVRRGLAYPCFCTEAELEAQREQQGARGLNKGYYGEWAACRDLSLAEQEAFLRAGRPFVLRLRSGGESSGRQIAFDDLIRGRIEMPENNMDAVLLKTDGIPTYHFAHAVDDHLMRVTHVIRGDEWIASVPLHLALFAACGFKPPRYAHISPLMKEDGGGKRKLSKRRDPEAAVSYFIEQGFPADSVLEYLLTLLNSNFEDWRKANPLAERGAFPFHLKKISPSGALFDLLKLTDVSKNRISLLPAAEVYGQALAWARVYDPELAAVFEQDPEYARNILNIDRETAKPRKDIAKWSELRDYLSYFYDAWLCGGFSLPETVAPQGIAPADAAAILTRYREVYAEADDREAWFQRIRELCEPLGFTPQVKEYKKNPEAYKGHVGDVSAVLRLALTGRTNTPDLFSIMGSLGRERVLARLDAALRRLTSGI